MVIENPIPTERWINNTQPLFYTPGPMRPVKLPDAVCVIPRPVLSNIVRQHGYYYYGATITLLNLHVIDINCGGNLCGHIDMFSNGILATFCPCYQTVNREANITCVFQLNVRTREGESMSIMYHTSKKMTNDCFKNRHCPLGLTESHFTASRRHRVALIAAIDHIFEYVNQNGGFTVTGWVRRGMVEDEGAEQPNRNEQPQMVEAGELTYHITSVEPTTPDAIDHAQLEEMRFDAAALVGGGNGEAADNV